MELNFDMPKANSSIIKVLGVGGGGGNAVNHMYNQGIKGVDFIMANTDAQALEQSPIPNKIQIGSNTTEGRGAGSRPEIGKKAALESHDDIKSVLDDQTKMLFITGGMGGGTGTGAAPIIAQAAREMGILTVGIVTTPFDFEGKNRAKRAYAGIKQLSQNVDTLLVISNDKLKEMFGNLSLSNAFSNADNILTTAAKGIAEIITVPGYINVDFEDVKTVMANSGRAIMGSASAEGDNRDKKAVEKAIHSPLLSDNDIKGAQYILLNISSGSKEVLMDEISTITDYIQEEAGNDVDMIWGNCYDENLGDQLSVTIIATAFQDVDEQDGEDPSPEAESGQTGINHNEGPSAIAGSDQATQVKDQESEHLPNNEESGTQEANPDSGETSDKLAAQQEPETEPASADNSTGLDAAGPEETGSQKGDETSSNEEAPSPDEQSGKQNGPHLLWAHNRFQDNNSPEQGSEYDIQHASGSGRHHEESNASINTMEGLEELENVPAYIRKGVQFQNTPHSSERANVSKYTLTKENDGHKTSVKERKNSFLDNNVD
jgi:cell division protein FtsZ